MPPVEIRRSAIAGLGTFTTGPIASGEIASAVHDPATLNHSCDPNLGWADECTLRAIRDIAAGEELTTDYSTSIDDPDFVLYCHCETYRCRQAVEGTDWQIPQLQARYAGRFAPHVQRRIDGG